LTSDYSSDTGLNNGDDKDISYAGIEHKGDGSPSMQ
jgi:hypothetical protein